MINKKIKELENTIEGLQFSVLVLNEMVNTFLNEDIKNESIKKGAEKLGKIKAIKDNYEHDLNIMTPSMMFYKYGRIEYENFNQELLENEERY